MSQPSFPYPLPDDTPGRSLAGWDPDAPKEKKKNHWKSKAPPKIHLHSPLLISIQKLARLPAGTYQPWTLPHYRWLTTSSFPSYLKQYKALHNRHVVIIPRWHRQLTRHLTVASPRNHFSARRPQGAVRGLTGCWPCFAGSALYDSISKTHPLHFLWPVNSRGLLVVLRRNGFENTR